MRTLYQQILKLEFWHDYYLGQQAPFIPLPNGYDVSAALKLTPTQDCRQVLKNLRWICRPQPQGLALYAEVEELSAGYRPQVPVNRPQRLTFWLEVGDRTFANFTNLPLAPARDQIFYFSNVSGTAQEYSSGGGGTETVLFLSQPLPTYVAGSEYVLGQLVIHERKTLEALQYQASSTARPGWNWKTLPLSQYVSNQDQLPRQGLTRSHRIPSANPGDTFRFTLIDVNGQPTFAHEITVPAPHPSGESLIVNLNFAGQSPGRYRLELNGTLVTELVLFDPLAQPNSFALVEIALTPGIVPAPFALLQASGSDTLIQPRTYIIRFKNRATRWRYHTEQPHGLNDGQLRRYGLRVIDSQTYVTADYLGLLQKPNPPPLNNGNRNLPFPSVAQIKPEIDAERHITQVFSDIYL
jgi:hypothetical protein